MKKTTVLLSVLAIAAGAFASELDDTTRRPTPLEINLAAPLKVWPFDRDVWGIRANILYGNSLNVYGLDFGAVGAARGDVAGVQANVFNWSVGDVYGVQIGALGSYTAGGVYGVQVSGLLNDNLVGTYGLQVAALNFGGIFAGVQAGALNWNQGEVAGLQVGVVNAERHDLAGASVGVFNMCNGNLVGGQVGLFNALFGTGSGFQLGLFNAAELLYGVQIGLINLNVKGCLPMMAIANANF